MFDAESYVTALRAAVTHAELNGLLAEIAKALDFDFYDLSFHVDEPDTLGLASTSTFPPPWPKFRTEPDTFYRTQFGALCELAVAGYSLGYAAANVKLGRAERKVMLMARKCGIGDAYVVPVRFSLGLAGSASFGVQSGAILPAQSLPAAHYLGVAAMEASVRISSLKPKADQPIASGPAALSPRQKECLALVARGRSDAEIGDALGLSKDTVHKHIQTAMRRMKVNTRAQLVARALLTAQLSPIKLALNRED